MNQSTDIACWATVANAKASPKIKGLLDPLLGEFLGGHDGAVQEGVRTVKAITAQLEEIRQRDARMVGSSIALLETAANFVDTASETGPLRRKQKYIYLLRRLSGQEPHIRPQTLFSALLSSRAEEDLMALNPFLSQETLKLLLSLVPIVLLRSNRMAMINRCLAAAAKLSGLLRETLRLTPEERSARRAVVFPTLSQACDALAGQLATQRHYMQSVPSVAPAAKKAWHFDPRFLVFEFAWSILLREKQVGNLLLKKTKACNPS